MSEERQPARATGFTTQSMQSFIHELEETRETSEWVDRHYDALMSLAPAPAADPDRPQRRRREVALQLHHTGG